MEYRRAGPSRRTGTYGVMHRVVACAVSGRWRAALGIGLLEPVVETLFHTFHERLWRRRG